MIAYLCTSSLKLIFSAIQSGHDTEHICALKHNDVLVTNMVYRTNQYMNAEATCCIYELKMSPYSFIDGSMTQRWFLPEPPKQTPTKHFITLKRLVCVSVQASWVKGCVCVSKVTCGGKT